ncbi:MAG: class II glutamine amidotransferase [Elusimicrobiota bacterium]
MCRLFAQVSPQAVSARDFLADSECSLLRQVDADPNNPQKDGWGLAWFGPDGSARVVKSGRPATDEHARFIAAADEARSSVVLGHIRAASKGIGIDAARAHPFTDEGWVFAHNGTLFIHKEVAAALGPRRARLKTDSDTEVYFQQFLKFRAEGASPSASFEACIVENWRLWESCRSRYPELSAPYTSLNAIASDGKEVHALCHATHQGLSAHGICHPDQPWSVMSCATRDGRFLLASEGVDRGDWTLLTPPETISAVPSATGVEVRRRPLQLIGPRAPVPEVSRP